LKANKTCFPFNEKRKILYLCISIILNNNPGKSMNKFKTVFSFLVISLLLAGCLQVETTINVKKDGSGTINEKVLMSKTFVNMIKEFAQAFQDSASTEEFAFFKDDEIIADAKDYGDDVKCVSHKVINDDQWEGFQAVYSFNDITKIKIQPDPDSKVGMGDEESEPTEDKEYYFFKFKKGDVSELIIDRPDIDFASDSKEDVESDTSEQSDEDMGEEFLKMMEGMKINIVLQVDGKIASTNATYMDGSKITLMQMDFGEMMKNKESFNEFKNKEPKNIEEMKEFLEKFPEMKIEIEKPISVKFK
jgi:hypothetical protein